ncbi:MAG: hypothetical protein RR734_03705 [Bacilli bacterium]
MDNILKEKIDSIYVIYKELYEKKVPSILKRFVIYNCCIEFRITRCYYLCNYCYYNHKKLSYLFYRYMLIKLRHVSGVNISYAAKVGGGVNY